eukprot:1026086-Alexandrium_andersonii.AAC.1
MLEFEEELSADPHTLERVAVCLDRLRSAQNACEAFGFFGHSVVRAALEAVAAGSHHLRLFRPA